MHDESIIVRNSRDVPFALPPTPVQHLGLCIIEVRFQKPRRLLRGLKVLFFPQHLIRARVGGDHQAVPCAQDLIVEMRPRPFLARFKESLLGLIQPLRGFLFAQIKVAGCLRDRMRFIQDVLVLELTVWITGGISAFSDAVTKTKDIRYGGRAR